MRHDRPSARTPLSSSPSSHSGATSAVRSTPECGSGSRPSSSRSMQHGRAGRPRLRPGGRRIRDRERRLVAVEAREDLGQRPVEIPSRLEQRPRDPVDVSGMAAARQAPGAERRVVGPDRAVVVAERVVGGVPGRHRADPPARPELVAHQPARDRVDPLGRDDPAPEQVADVRAERVDAPLLAVERERVVAAAVLDPERLVEAAPQLGRLRLEPGGERIVAPDGARELGDPQLRVVDVALHLGRRDRRLRRSVPSWKRCESPESFHDWFSSPRGVRRSYSTKPSPSRSPYSSIQRSAASAGSRSRCDDARVGGPAPDLGEQDRG